MLTCSAIRHSRERGGFDQQVQGEVRIGTSYLVFSLETPTTLATLAIFASRTRALAALCPSPDNGTAALRTCTKPPGLCLVETALFPLGSVIW